MPSASPLGILFSPQERPARHSRHLRYPSARHRVCEGATPIRAQPGHGAARFGRCGLQKLRLPHPASPAPSVPIRHAYARTACTRALPPASHYVGLPSTRHAKQSVASRPNQAALLDHERRYEQNPRCCLDWNCIRRHVDCHARTSAGNPSRGAEEREGRAETRGGEEAVRGKEEQERKVRTEIQVHRQEVQKGRTCKKAEQGQEVAVRNTHD